eukprot:CAMPEP_0170059054 /NCGR_PEP_ID=MMETSP0019_2-20121128/1461_1 /TAXON_ID=98059 /ORGANISM="Dinobryon sp., Strain UTEXLB2267" /LENGTH=298 /DNA_ID=CAMNT_0010264179 /DNA_START=184 /DNA_END=1077 /DNA_ORIENTATION=-
MEENKCLNCFMFNPLCICQKVKEVFSNNVGSRETNVKASVAIFMHYKEWGRSSNTGKIFQIGMHHKSTLGLYGVEESESHFIENLSKSPVLVLYPSSRAKPISEFKEWYQSTPNVTLCVLDSTWTQSAALDKAIPSHIPRVKVDDFVSAPSQFLNRKQSQNKSRVSTVEAVAIALSALGEPPEAIEPFFKALQLSVDSVLTQNGRLPAYGARIVPQLSLTASSNGPFTVPSIEKPQQCPLCKATQLESNFKNMGTHKRSRNTPKPAPLTSKEEGSDQDIYEKPLDLEDDVDTEAIRVW